MDWQQLARMYIWCFLFPAVIRTIHHAGRFTRKRPDAGKVGECSHNAAAASFWQARCSIIHYKNLMRTLSVIDVRWHRDRLLFLSRVRPIVTNAAWSLLSVCLCVWLLVATGALQQRLNRSKCRLRAWTHVGPSSHVFGWGSRSPRGSDNIWGGRGEQLQGNCKVQETSWIRSIFSTSFGRWQQRCGLSLSIVQQLVIFTDGNL